MDSRFVSMHWICGGRLVSGGTRRACGSISEASAQRRNGRLAAPVEPGLGVKPREEVLGKPVFVYPALYALFLKCYGQEA